MTKVAILGAGPAGVMAAYAVERNGLEPVIYAARREPSPINEDMFLQRPLPDVPGHDRTFPDGRVEYKRHGDQTGYAAKCYGSSKATVSWSNIKWGWDSLWWLREVYTTLWERYEGGIVPTFINSERAHEIADNHYLTISTIPAVKICSNPEHLFSSVPTWLVRQPWHPTTSKIETNYMLVYDGLHEHGWFRQSWLRGWVTWEYAKDPAKSFPDEVSPESIIIPGQKFLGNTCNCHASIHRVGRWAQWQRGVLNHHAFEQTTALLASVGLGKGA